MDSLHFTDSNIILGKISIVDSTHDECETYFDRKYENYISLRVEKECELNLFKSKKLYPEIFNHLIYELNNSKFDLTNLDFEIEMIKKSFLNKYKNDKYPVGFNKSYFYDNVKSIFNKIHEDICQSIICDDFSILNKKYMSVNDKFLDCQFNLKKFILTLLKCPNYTENHKNKILLDNLLKIDGIHKSDAEILLDSNELDGNVVFITNDRDILKNTSNIKKRFKKDFDIHDVYYFLN